MKVVTALQMQEIDKVTINEYGIHGEVLMAIAGKSVADYIKTHVYADAIAVLCGVGNNGGDGYVAAYFLSHYIKTDVFVAGAIQKLTPSSQIYFELCKKAAVPVYELTDTILQTGILNNYDIIVDALTGTGFSGTPKDLLLQGIEAINKSCKAVVSIDMPSGLPADGILQSEAIVKAHVTVTMGLPKVNLVTYPGKDYAGHVVVADIGFPEVLLKSNDIKRQLIDDDYIISNYRPQKNYDAHKGTNGHLLCIGGFDGMEGAIMLVSEAAFAAGIGLVTIATTPKARTIIAGKIKEAITKEIELDDYADVFIDEMTHEVLKQKQFIELTERITTILQQLITSTRCSACAIGPGLGRSIFSAAVVKSAIAIVKERAIPAIIDGDGLFHCAMLHEHFSPDKTCIITPHFKEASRLLNVPVDDIKQDRLSFAEKLAGATGAITVLKGPASIVSDGVHTTINTTGNPALATGGSGDVLAGIIGSLLANRITPLVAASIGVYIHGKAADIYCDDSGYTIMQAGDIIQNIRKAYGCLPGM